MMLKYFLSAIFAVLIIGLTATPVVAKSLNDAQIRAEIIGKTLKFRTRQNLSGTVIHRSNGTIFWKTTAGNGGDGEWRIEGDKLCTIYNRTRYWPGWPWRCLKVRRIGEKYRYSQSTYWR